ncbi:hypothetical protein G6F55_014309 [Rhizopus delemar]|nr:hypothetical protein G6F55_014309 [Rhizopus delemar]
MLGAGDADVERTGCLRGRPQPSAAQGGAGTECGQSVGDHAMAAVEGGGNHAESIPGRRRWVAAVRNRDRHHRAHAAGAG